MKRGVLRGPGVVTLGRDLFLSSDSDQDYRALLAAYLSALPEDVTAVDGVSALRLWGVEVGPELPYRFVTTARHHSVRPDVRVRRAGELGPCTQAVLDPVPALVAARADLDLASLVVAGDWLIREGQAELTIVSEQGFLARVDLYLRAWRVAGEYEGDHHRTDADQYAKDLRRYEELAAFGVLPIREAFEPGG